VIRPDRPAGRSPVASSRGGIPVRSIRAYRYPTSSRRICVLHNRYGQRRRLDRGLKFPQTCLRVSGWSIRRPRMRRDDGWISIRALIDEPEFATRASRLGIVLQAYLVESPRIARSSSDWLKRERRKDGMASRIRLVKGAYWNQEATEDPGRPPVWSLRRSAKIPKTMRSPSL